MTRLWEIFSNERDCHEGLRAAFTAHAVMLSGLYGGREYEVRDLLGRPRPRDQRYRFRTVRGMIRRAQQAEALRTDLPPGELANYALNALAAAEGLPVKEAVQRIVTLTLAAIERNAAD